MIVTLRALNAWVDLSDQSPEEIARLLTDCGLEVESMHPAAQRLAGVLVARILETSPHPSADRLQVCSVDDGSGRPVQVVCGAPNAAAGMTVPLARPGTQLPDGRVIAAASVRDIASEGMLCSAMELDLDESHDGIMELSGGLTPGTALADALDLHDTIYELSVTPNRGDCWSIRGVARDLAARLLRPLRPLPQPIPASSDGTTDGFGAAIAALDGCSRYGLLALEGVRVGPSPPWLVRMLRRLGHRSINNVVDVTNWVLLDWGQPMHAFDRDRLQGDTLTVALAAPGEAFVALDGIRRELAGDELTIRDADGPVALAGVIGGQGSAVGPETQRIVLEAACFRADWTRRTSRRHGLRTDSSQRFERGVDPSMPLHALAQAARLIASTMNAEPGAAPGVAHAAAFREGSARPRNPIHLGVQTAPDLLGVAIEPEDQEAWLRALGGGVTRTGEGWLVDPPSHRMDWERPEDLVEEIGRMMGYDRIEPRLPEGVPGLRPSLRTEQGLAQQHVPVQAPARRRFLRDVRSVSEASGLHATVHLALVDPADLRRVAAEPVVEVVNPLSADQSVLRSSLLPSLLHSVARNLAQGMNSVALYETAAVFCLPPGTYDGPEPLRWTAVATGPHSLAWHEGLRPWDALDLVGVARDIGLQVGRPVVARPVGDGLAWLHPGERATLVDAASGAEVGWVGQLHPAVVEAWGIEAPVMAAEIELEVLWSARPTDVPRARTPVRRSPSVRDVSLMLPQGKPWSAVEDSLEALRPSSLEGWQMFDVWRDPSWPDGQRSCTVRLVWRPPGTQTEAELAALHDGFLVRLCERAGVAQRA
jgi:phenylalanyl-tRNA synthetase beta chain